MFTRFLQFQEEFQEITPKLTEARWTKSIKTFGERACTAIEPFYDANYAYFSSLRRPGDFWGPATNHPEGWQAFAREKEAQGMTVSLSRDRVIANGMSCLK